VTATVVTNATIVTVDQDDRVVTNGTLVALDGAITYVGPSADAPVVAPEQS
jgi:cytosine/adenosine deaminase-related metal-dependent hydrolase